MESMYTPEQNESQRATQATFQEEVMRITGDVLNSGAVEEVFKEKILKAFSDVFNDSLSWSGAIKKTIQSRLEEVMVPYIEKYDMSAYVVKLDAILGELLETTYVNENKKILENFKSLMTPPDKKTITLDEIFDEYCKFVAESVDTDKLDIDHDDTPSYCSVEVHAEVIEDEKPYGYYSSFETLKLYLHPTELEQEDLCFSIDLTHWKHKDEYSISYKANPTIFGLSKMSNFECFLLSLSKANISLVGPIEEVGGWVTPEKEPEAYLSYR